MKSASLPPLHKLRRKPVKRDALAAAISAAIMGFSSAAWGQATNGTIQGTVPPGPGEAVQITGGAGFNRTITVGQSGDFSITLPVGTYTVSFLQNGKVVQTQTDVSPVAAGTVVVDFTKTSGEDVPLTNITVSARTLSSIDVATTNQVTTITSEDLQRLPLGRSAADIAMLAPGVNMGSPALNSGPLGAPINVFGGASIAENAYYIDGMNVTDALTAQGGIDLPYDVIRQEQTYTTGYGAKYGRSIGGVINQIGKTGNNDLHFGFRALTQPAFAQGNSVDSFYANPLETAPGETPGSLHTYRRGDNYQETIYDAYLSGPIIPDTLFFFVAAEADSIGETTLDSVEDPYANHEHADNPKYYAKLNWNINKNNVLSVTGVQSSHNTTSADYNFDYSTLTPGTFSNLDQTSKTTFTLGVANFTSYITDWLTFDGTFGKSKGTYFTEQPAYPGFNPSLPHIGSPSLQDPRFAPPGGIVNSNPYINQSNPNHEVDVTSYRASLNFKWRTHDITLGIDNINSYDKDDGFDTTGPGYAWLYGYATPGYPVFGALGADPNVPPYVGPSNQCTVGTDGQTHCYYVEKYVNSESASVKVIQRAQYIEDNWHVTQNLLVSIGLRNDQFTNYDSFNVPYINLTSPQWAPRLGFSWDVHGDSTFKVFGNAGRYYLALPLTTALSIASPVVSAGQYGTYTGINQATGEPTGFKPLPQNPSTGVSIDSEYGQAKDPRVSASQNIKAEYSDNFVLGLQHALQFFDQKWVFGASTKYQRMPRIIDDYDDEQTECAAGFAQGYTFMTPATCSQWAQSLVLINPGVTNNLLMKSPSGGLVPVTFTEADQGFTSGPSRQYLALDLSLDHPWDGKWSFKILYTLSRTWGNTEGPVSTYSQQSGSYESITTAWDFPERMQYASGTLPNDRTHVIKAFGSYGITKELTVGANLLVESGTPRLCRGYYGPEQEKLYGSSTFYWCGGVPAPPGSLGRLPWVSSIDLSLDYRPEWASHKLDFNAAVFNAFNNQAPLFQNDSFLSTQNPNPDYGYTENFQAPRTARFSIAYDF
jgi:hypothetical protein